MGIPDHPAGPVRSPDVPPGGGSGGGGGGEPRPVPRPARAEDIVPMADDSSTPAPVRVPSASAKPAAGDAAPSKIRAFSQQLGSTHQDKWNRAPNTPGTGAIHVKSFHCKLTGDSLIFLDQQINEWLDTHPQYEVKLVTSSIGEWTGKLKEPNLIINVWV